MDNCKCPLPCHVTKYHTKMSSAYVPFNNWWTLRYGHKMSGQELEDNRFLKPDLTKDNYMVTFREIAAHSACDITTLLSF